MVEAQGIIKYLAFYIGFFHNILFSNDVILKNYHKSTKLFVWKSVCCEKFVDNLKILYNLETLQSLSKELLLQSIALAHFTRLIN